MSRSASVRDHSSDVQLINGAYCKYVPANTGLFVVYAIVPSGFEVPVATLKKIQKRFPEVPQTDNLEQVEKYLISHRDSLPTRALVTLHPELFAIKMVSLKPEEYVAVDLPVWTLKESKQVNRTNYMYDDSEVVNISDGPIPSTCRQIFVASTKLIPGYKLIPTESV